MPARSRSMSSSLPKPLRTMSAPWAARARAVANPMPLVDPVTSASLLLSIRFPLLTCIERTSPLYVRPRMLTMNEPQLRYVTCPDPRGLHRMAYWEWGAGNEGPVVVCVHGLTRNGRDFDAVAERLATRFRVVCPDMIGRGRSDRAADP